MKVFEDIYIAANKIYYTHGTVQTEISLAVVNGVLSFRNTLLDGGRYCLLSIRLE